MLGMTETSRRTAIQVDIYDQLRDMQLSLQLIYETAICVPVVDKNGRSGKLVEEYRPI